MQLSASQVVGDRPECPRERSHRVHRHASYERYADCEGTARIHVLRFLCTHCVQTISVVPDDRLPYRSLSLPILCAWLEWHFNEGPAPPVAGEKERGCAQRALKCFVLHSRALIHALGQIIPTVKADAGVLWQVLRRLNRTGAILGFLQARLKPVKRRGFSLLGAYRCLTPGPQSTG